MADNEIVKALECCSNGYMCDKCPYYKDGCSSYDANMSKDVLDLIKRQKAEIERLTALVEAAEDYLNPLPFKNAFDEEIEKTKIEAIKDFAEKLKNVALPICIGEKYEYEVVTKQAIDYFVKEMAGDTDEG